LVKEGTMEAATIDDVLYKGQNTKDESIKFLNEVGFEVTRIEDNDPHGNEVNIYFRNPNPREIKFNKVWNYL
jgi:nanoRNase/pAp phosphatase (c-di-AMP/oligoRNAs hydrolase)